MTAASRDTHDIVGPVIVPGDHRYDDATVIYNRLHQARPARVIQPVDHADVARALALAQREGREVAVRGGGHSIAGFSTTEDGILIDLGSLDRIDVDAELRTATVGGGVRAGALTTATHDRGLVVPLGDSPDVGVTGLTLGGGIGWLSRKFGLTLDSLDSADVVLADGTVVTAREDSHPDLFWALRGGGGNFGIVTSLRFRLHRLGHVLGGMLVLPATPDVIRGVLDTAANAPDELGIIALVTRLGPLPIVPTAARCRLAVLITLVWCGDEAEGQRHVDELRALGPPLVDAVRARPYTDMYTLLAGAAPPTITNITSTLLSDVSEFDDRAINSVLHAFQDDDPGETVLSAVELRVLGGAVARVDPDVTAFGHRRRDLVCSAVKAGFAPASPDPHRAWVRSLTNQLRHLSKGAYVNFVGDADGQRLQAAYPPATLRRLTTIKARYDPDNVFHRNLNIRP